MVVYVDVDNTMIRTLGTEQKPITEVLEHLRRLKKQGVALYCWSAGGAEYARQCATNVGVAELFEAFLPKPRVMLDDQHISEWPFCVTVHPDWCHGKTWDDYLTTDLQPGKMNK